MIFLLYLDKTANLLLGWLLGGGLQPWGWTLSDRLWLLKTRGSWVGTIGCSLLNIAESNHCDKAIGNERS